MRIGVPKETKVQEYRVGMVPGSVRELTSRGHQVAVEHAAGAGIGFSDEDYRAAGAEILSDAAAVFDRAELIVKVKELQPEERALLRPEHTLFTYLHLAPDPQQTFDLVASGAACIAYETVTDAQGRLPLLAPMSEVAGRLALQAGAWCLEKLTGGSGVLLGGIPGVEPGKVLILGGGHVGFNACQMAVGLGARVVVMDRAAPVLRRFDAQFASRITTVYSGTDVIERHLVDSDLIIGAVLVPGAATPKLVRRDQLGLIREGSVLVDVAIDQGGCFESSRPTTHDEPTYVEQGIVHYCVTNMPGVVPRTSTIALNNATLPFVIAMAEKGIMQALREDPHLLNGLNVFKGKVTEAPVAEAQGIDFVAPEDAISSEF
ncbi:MAG: alanine dehydrogenase [Pseudomonadota bacterium]